MDNLFWLGVVASVQNLTCISFDRFYAVRVPSKYKVHQTQLIVGCFLYEVAVTLFLFIPNFFLRRYQSNRCASAFAIDGPTTEQFFEVHSYLWMILNYLLPASIMVSAHGYVVYVIRKPAVGQQTGQIARKNIRRLILTTSMMAGFLVVLHSYEAIRYILGSSDIVHTEVGSVAQQIGVLFITLSAVLNPCLLVATSHTVRKQVVKNVLHFDALDASTSATNKNTDNKCCVGSICLSLKTEKISNSTTTECQLGQLGQSLRNAEYYRDKYSCFLCLINTVKEQHAMDSNHHGDSRDPKNKDNDLGLINKVHSFSQMLIREQYESSSLSVGYLTCSESIPELHCCVAANLMYTCVQGAHPRKSFNIYRNTGRIWNIRNSSAAQYMLPKALLSFWLDNFLAVSLTEDISRHCNFCGTSVITFLCYFWKSVKFRYFRLPTCLHAATVILHESLRKFVLSRRVNQRPPTNCPQSWIIAKQNGRRIIRLMITGAHSRIRKYERMTNELKETCLWTLGRDLTEQLSMAIERRVTSTAEKKETHLESIFSRLIEAWSNQKEA
ncbi:amine GPCR [Clonorchis sinensis]|uniref:Amine GPCR n=1 Tax=Clonorchis sinensis TaxID=79923 RepID=H2KQ42_CLOSI|nr:amine GPCR [Clonorchis sinensis]